MLTEEDKQWIQENVKQQIQENLKPFENLMTNLFHSLEGELRTGFRDMNTLEQPKRGQ